MDKYTPHTWQPHERPSLPGSPSTPLHPTHKRWLFALVGILVAITGGLGNALVIANLQYLQGALGATTAEMAWLPAAYVMTNVCMNLLLVKFRQQFGLRAFTEVFLVLYALVTFAHFQAHDAIAEFAHSREHDHRRFLRDRPLHRLRVRAAWLEGRPDRPWQLPAGSATP